MRIFVAGATGVLGRRLGGSVGEMLARSLRISNRKLKSAGGWAPRYRTTLDGFKAVIGESS